MQIIPYAPHALVSEQTRQLPFFLCTLGLDTHQTPTFRPNGMMDFQLLFSVGGRGTVELEEGIFPMEPGDVLFSYPGEKHKYYQTGKEPWKVHWITFFGDSVVSLTPSQSRVYHTKNLAAYEEILSEMRKKDAATEAAELSVQLYRLLLLCKKELFSANGPTVVSSQERLTEVLEFMRNHFAQALTLGDLSERMGISDSQLCRVFQTAYGMRPMEYLNILRMNHAKALLLRDKEQPVADIGHAVGIHSPSYFTKTFRRYVGTSPNEYRRLY